MTAKEFSQKFKLNLQFVELLDKGFESNWTREEVEMLHTDELVGKEFSIHIDAINKSVTRHYKVTGINTLDLKPGTVRLEVINTQTNQPVPMFSLRKSLITTGGVSLKGLLSGHESFSVQSQIM